MSNPQSGIFHEGSRFHRYIEVQLADVSVDSATSDANADFNECAAIKKVIAQCVAAIEKNQQREVFQVIAFSQNYWSRLSPQSVPEGLLDFPGYASHKDGANKLRVAPATQRQCFIWLHSDDLDALTDAYLEMVALFKPLAHVLFSCDGFVYRDSRDLTGFIDGSANPKDDARFPVAVIADGKVGAGGSFVLTQQWSHRLAKFHQLPEAEQEQVIGRTKRDSIELSGDAMPADSHVSRTDLKLGGVAQKIYRRSTPFVQAEQSGLYFLAFSTELSRFDVLLKSMYGHAVNGEAVHDRLTEFSEPISGSYWFAPSSEALVALR